MADPIITYDESTKRTALAAGMAAPFLSSFAVSTTNVALPAIAADFRMSAVLLALVPMSYIVSGAVFLLPFGRLADMYGRKKVFAIGVTLFAVASILCGFSTSGEVLILLRALQGVGSCMMYGIVVAILLSVYPPQEAGRVLGFTVGAVYLGLSVGPLVGGFLTQQFGWRSVFFATGIPAAGVAMLVLLRLKGEWAEARGETFDLAGSALYCAAVTAVLYGFNLLPAKRGFLFLAAGLAGLYLFLVWETKVEHPVFKWTLFRRNRVFVMSSIATFINYAATYSIGFLMSLYLQYSKHLSPQQAGFALMAQPVIQAAFSPYAGRLSDRILPQNVAAFGMGLTVLGLAIFACLGSATPLWLVMGTLALHGLGFALFSSPNANAVMGSVEKRFYGVASGINSTMRLLGNSFSIGTSMLIFSLYIGRAQITPERYPAFLSSVKLIFAVFACLCLGGVFASLSRAKSPKRAGA